MRSAQYDPLQRSHGESLELASLASSSNSGQAGSASVRSSISHSSRDFDFSDQDPLTISDHERGPTDPDDLPPPSAFSTGSIFEFGTTLYPLSRTAPLDSYEVAQRNRLEKDKTLTYFNGLSLVIGIIIGSGIFSAPSQVNSHAGSPGGALIGWLVAGLLAWTGAACFAELGGALPLNGGAQVYLSMIFGKWVGFLFTWAAVLMLKPGSAAIISIIFGEYVVRACLGADAIHVNPWLNKAVALVVLVAVTLLNCVSKKVSTRSADALMILKFVALIAVTITGIVVATGAIRPAVDPEWRKMNWFAGTSRDPSEWAISLYAGLWAYDGWDNVNFVAGEFINPKRDIPLVIHTSMPVVIIFFVLANVSYYLVLPPSVIDSSNTVAIAFGSAAYGHIGAVLFALAVSGSCFGALNASTFASGRLVYVAGKEGYLPDFFARIGVRSANSIRTTSFRPRGRPSRIGQLLSRFGHIFADPDGEGFFHTPVNALVLNAVLTAIYILIGEFRTLLSFYGVIGYGFLFLVVLGVIVLRVRDPGLERPYKTWITTPIIFCCVCLFLLSRTAFSEPIKTLGVVAFVLLGVPVYWWRIGRPQQQIKRQLREFSLPPMGGHDDRDDRGRAVKEYPFWQVWKRWT